jgi:lipopolysaccharide export system protein LptA
VRFTIERMRTLVLAAGVLLIVALSVFLVIGKWRNSFNRRDLPKRLGIDIQEEANGWTYTHGFRGHTLYKIHASKWVQLRQNSHVLLHDVQIELYGVDGNRVDRIQGADFEYDPIGGVAKAAGQVEITLMRPSVAPAIAPNATPKEVLNDKLKSDSLVTAAQTASQGEIHVRTSGLTFDRNSGKASTTQEVQFAVAQGTGRAVGASYDAQQGQLVLDHDVELETKRGADTVSMRAEHAEFERGDQVCHLRVVRLAFGTGEATAEQAAIVFRADGSAEKLNVERGFALKTAKGGHLAAPTGWLEFDAHNEPRQGQLEGGVIIDSENEGRRAHGTAPRMGVEFAEKGELRSTHLEKGVEISSDDQTTTAGEPVHTHRTWFSPVVDVAFRNTGRGKVEPASIHGTGGVVVTGESQRGGGPSLPSRMTADDLTGTFGSNGALSSIAGAGHTSIVETTPKGIRQTTSGDKLEAQFASTQVSGMQVSVTGPRTSATGLQIQSATIDGHVVLEQQPTAKSSGSVQTALRATAGRAVYEGAGEWLHLMQSPRVTDGGLELTAEGIDVSQSSGDAFAHRNVKATWTDERRSKSDEETKGGLGQGSVLFNGQGAAHAVAAEAQLHQATGEATFQGNARLWQQANSIAAPVIVLDRTKQTLVARSTNSADPVQVVVLSNANALTNKPDGAAPPSPAVIRMRGGDLKYSGAERKAVMHGGTARSVVASTSDVTTVSNEVELTLLSPGNHAGKEGAAGQIDHMTARGHVVVTSANRKGTGEELNYSSDSGEYILTGTAAAPPRMTDPARGTVTGDALIFSSRDDSVSIEGGGRKTTTVTTAPK